MEKKLIAMAVEARKNAYAPYSEFSVGAALLCEDGRIFTGCNMENASYGASICAERVALGKAISEGKRKFSMLAIVVGGDKICTPCGICRQSLIEFSGKLKVICANESEPYQTFILEELLPQAFSLLP